MEDKNADFSGDYLLSALVISKSIIRREIKHENGQHFSNSSQAVEFGSFRKAPGSSAPQIKLCKSV